MNRYHSYKAIDELRTLRDLLRWGASRFNEAGLYFGHGTDNAWDEAVVLALHALHLPIDNSAEMTHARLTKIERRQVIELYELRVHTRMPAAYLTHEAWFAGLPFYVDKRVIIPRSPIAELIEQQFSPWVGSAKVRNILDLCAGSACMGIACAHYFPEANVDSVEHSEAALFVASKNISQHKLNHRVKLIQSDLFAAISNKRYDIIVTNPPYVGTVDMATLPTEYRHEPRTALAAGVDGLAIIERILAQAGHYLSDQGILVAEVGHSAAALTEKYPKMPFLWLEFKRGGDGVFLLTKQQLPI